MLLENNTIIINSERSPNIAAFVPARLLSLRNSSSIIFRLSQSGLFTCTNLLLKRRGVHSSTLATRRPANLLKGKEDENKISMAGDIGVGHSDCACDSVPSASGLAAPRFLVASVPRRVRLIRHIPDKLPNQMNNVKIKISRERKNA